MPRSTGSSCASGRSRCAPNKASRVLLSATAAPSKALKYSVSVSRVFWLASNCALISAAVAPESCHWYSPCKARRRACERAREPPECIFTISMRQLLEQIGHLQGGLRRIRALVASCAASPRLRLFQRVASEHAKADRHMGIQHHPHDAAGAFSGHIIEMRRLAANHRAERDDGPVAATDRRLIHRHRNVER